MSNTVVLKRSAVQNKTPTTSDLALGELALNTYDGNLFFKKDNGTASILSVATVTGTQTLTNKTLNSATANNLILTGTLTAGGGVGTSGQVLSSTGSGVQWTTAGSGDVTLTGTQTLTNKTLSSAVFTGTLTAGGGVGTSGQVLSSTGSGVQWVDQTGGGGTTSDSFSNIAVSGQSTVVADSSTDTLTLASAGVIGILTNATTDTITITTNKSFPFTKYDGNASNIPLYTEASLLSTSLDTVYLPFIKTNGTSVTTLKLTA
jgi:hypothetical protein